MFSKILIANRGEIACRIIRTAKQLNIKTVAIHSIHDSESMHVIEADESVLIDGITGVDSYLNTKSIKA